LQFYFTFIAFALYLLTASNTVGIIITCMLVLLLLLSLQGLKARKLKSKLEWLLVQNFIYHKGAMQ